jgi:hypothetical protein
MPTSHAAPCPPSLAAPSLAAAQVSVKLVAEAGIGVVASGVAKANADVIQISGHDGGTGASPISSIKHAGGPVEMGVAETHQVLTRNELRDRVVLRADGGFRSGRDILMSAALGADEYGFGTVAMIATGCIMARVCHTNNCPVGVASQREELRARFPGAPADLVNFFHFVAEEVRGSTLFAAVALNQVYDDWGGVVQPLESVHRASGGWPLSGSVRCSVPVIQCHVHVTQCRWPVIYSKICASSPRPHPTAGACWLGPAGSALTG